MANEPVSPIEPENPQALKHIFNRQRLEHIADQATAVCPAFDRSRFLALCSDGAENLSVMQRMRRVATSLHAALPGGYRQNLKVLRRLAPRIDNAFVCLALSEYVAIHGLDDFDASMDALKFFTTFGSAEFAIRPFLLQDLERTMAVMHEWAGDADEHVRRLASEGCRPRLPWAGRIPALAADPWRAEPILQRLRSDPALYVRKSVANHLNDITKDHPAWVMARLESWPLETDRHSAWIARHALRTLIKEGDRRALAIVGAGAAPEVSVIEFSVQPTALHLGDRLCLKLTLRSTARGSQRLVVDYTIHYVKAAGHASPKVFKWKTLDLLQGGAVTLQRSQVVRDFSTRKHHPGRHEVFVTVNGERVAQSVFEIRQAGGGETAS
jgi:3-methyladenine DNA glycosylase AlkC